MAPWWNPETPQERARRRARRIAAAQVACMMAGELALIALIAYALASGLWMAR